MHGSAPHHRFIFLNRGPAEGGAQNQGESVAELKKLIVERAKQSKLNAAQKKNTIEGVLSPDPRNNEVANLKRWLTSIPAAERGAEEFRAKYREKIEKAVTAGRSSKEHMQEHLDWFSELSFENQIKYLQKCHLDDPKRAEVVALYKKLPPEMQKGFAVEFFQSRFKDKLKFMEKAQKLAALYTRLPAAVRAEIKDEIAVGSLSDAERLIEKKLAHHEQLKGRFLKLDEKMQREMRSKFKQGTIRERETLLTQPGEQKIDSRETRRAEFMEKMESRCDQKLFSRKSIPAYELWFNALTDQKQHDALAHSALDNPRREELRDAFYNLPQSIRTPALEQKFLDKDLEGREALLAELTGESGSGAKYSDAAITRVLSIALDAEELRMPRLLYTLVHKVQIYTRRAELKDTTSSAVEVKKEHSELYDETRGVPGMLDPEIKDLQSAPKEKISVLKAPSLRSKKDEREDWRKSMLTLERKKGKSEAEIRDIALKNDSGDILSAEAFQHQVVAHAHSELLDGLSRFAEHRLPGIRREQLRKLGAKLPLDVDLAAASAA